MSDLVLDKQRPLAAPALRQLWFTRCPVPTATGLAYKLGWLEREFAPDGIALATLQEQPAGSTLAHRHYDHDLDGLIREGGNMLALAARAQGADTRLIGLTWIDEAQAIVVRPGSGIRRPEQLRGLRVALPRYVDHPIPSHVRGCSIARGMSLHGVKGLLASSGLGLDEVRFVEVEATLDRSPPANLQGLWAGLEHLARGAVDAVYVKGASALDAARRLGLEVGIDIDALPLRHRVNNGTPRPITVHRKLLEAHGDLVARFLAQALRAADWAAGNLEGVRRVLQDETRGSPQAVADAYRNGFERALHPDLSEARVALLRQQADFLLLHGFLDADIDFDTWIDRRPLAAARALLAAGVSG